MGKEHTAIERAEIKHTILQLSRRYGIADVARMVDLPKDDAKRLLEEGLRDLQDQTEDLGRAYAMLHLQKIEHCEKIMVGFIDEFHDVVKKNENGVLTEQAMNAAEVVFKSIDRLDKLLTRGSKLLGLDAPLKVQASAGEGNTPERILNHAMELESENPSDVDFEDLGDAIGSL